jgi:threonine/homoserine/homoserine lactone efflux protein
MSDHFLAFLGVSILVIATPGPDTALTIRNALLGGRRGGIFTALGVAAGQAVWALATSVGIVALLVASEPVFLAVKLAGAVYLVVLLPGAVGRAASRRLAACRDRRRRKAAPGPVCRLPPGRHQRSRQSEDGRLLHQPAAAIHPRWRRNLRFAR